MKEDMNMGQQLCSNVYEATCSRFTLKFIAKFASFDRQIPRLNAETSAYQWIENHQIGPEFLRHLTEEGSIIGFIVELMDDCHHATPEDLAPC